MMIPRNKEKAMTHGREVEMLEFPQKIVEK